MADLKLFRLEGGGVVELEGQAVALEKSLQTVFETNLEPLLGVRFLASELATSNGGRMDTLGIDENDCPVIIEYKRATNENVINQGLFYLDWLMDHQADFKLLVLELYGTAAADAVEWTSPRLICIAGNFTKYDEHAVKQINRNIELIRYRRFGTELLLLDLLTATSSATPGGGSGAVGPKTPPQAYKTVSDVLSSSNTALRDSYEAVRAHLLSLGDDVQEKTLKFYFAFKRIKNFACVELKPQTGRVLVFVKVDPDTVVLEKGFTRDVRNVGHFGTGDLEISIASEADFEKAKPLFERSYEAS